MYYFLTGIQYVHDWDKWLKTIYDMQSENHIAATGSASPALKKGSGESGTRNKEIDVVVEYSNIKNILVEVKDRECSPVSDDGAACTLAGESSVAFIVTKSPDDFGVHDTKSGEKIIEYPPMLFFVSARSCGEKRV